MKFEKLENIALALTVVCSLLAGGAAAQTKPAIELEAAMTKEQVNGDLKAAIAAYQKIAADAAAPRDVRAKALLHLAGCYEKLGQEAQKVYQQIVRDFPDQPAAAQARTRLAALQQANHATTPAAMTQRKIEMPEGTNFGPGDTDGRRVVYWSGATREVIYRDLVTGAKRVIFKAQTNDSLGWSPSKDFSTVALVFQDTPKRVAVIKTDGTGYRELIRDDVQQTLFGDRFQVEWSWDNRHILITSRSSKQILIVSVETGDRRQLITVKNGALWASRFSPDGRFVAYHALPKEHPSPNSPGTVSQIFVIPSQGGEPRLVYEEASHEFFRTLDWTPDGRYLAITSMRTGKAALHLIPVNNGQPAGAPVFVQYVNVDAGYSTKGGAFIYSTVKPGGFGAGHMASLDLNDRPGNWQALEFRGHNYDDPHPHWSPDSAQIVYSALEETGNHPVVRQLSTGEEREFYHGPVGNCIWGTGPTKMFCTDGYAKSELLSIAADSGKSERLGALISGLTLLVQSSRDGKAVYYWNVQSRIAKLVRRDTASGVDAVLTGPEEFWVGLSLDERWLIQTANKGSRLEIRPLAGGDWTTLATHDQADAKPGTGFGQFGSTPDGNWILYHDADTAGHHSLFRVPAGGGAPERLGDFPVKDLNGTLQISPDGRKLIVSSRNNVNRSELWSLENFVPPAPKK